MAYPFPLLRGVDLRALDDDRVRREVDPPGQGARGDQDLQVSVGEEVFDLGVNKGGVPGRGPRGKARRGARRSRRRGAPSGRRF